MCFPSLKSSGITAFFFFGFGFASPGGHLPGGGCLATSVWPSSRSLAVWDFYYDARHLCKTSTVARTCWPVARRGQVNWCRKVVKIQEEEDEEGADHHRHPREVHTDVFFLLERLEERTSHAETRCVISAGDAHEPRIKAR